MFHAILRHLIVALVSSMVSVTIAWASGDRVALVIGNSAYRHATPLANPKNDAIDMAVAAEKLGFKVIKGLDLDKTGMDRTIREFAAVMRGAEIGLFFYAGHGLQVAGRNYLVPIDAELKTAEALDFEMIGLDVVQRIMEAATETNILFVDACRDNPLARNLARAMGTRSTAIGHGLTAQEAGAGTLISFSTQPGNVALDGTGGRNSPYAAALVKHIITPGKDLPALLIQVRRDVMAATGKRQIPWEHSALTAEIMLARGDVQQMSTNANAREGAVIEGVQSDTELHTAVNKTAAPDPGPQEPRQRVVNVGAGIGTLKIINGDSNGYLYTEKGRKISVSPKNASGAMPTNEAVELPSGRYYLKNDGGLVTVKAFEIGPGENVTIDLKKHVGSLRVVNSVEKQYLFGENERLISVDGTFMSTLPVDSPVELPQGIYHLRTGNPHPRVTAGPFEIRAGEETVIDFAR